MSTGKKRARLNRMQMQQGTFRLAIEKCLLTVRVSNHYSRSPRTAWERSLEVLKRRLDKHLDKDLPGPDNLRHSFQPLCPSEPVISRIRRLTWHSLLSIRPTSTMGEWSADFSSQNTSNSLATQAKAAKKKVLIEELKRFTTSIQLNN